MPKILKFSALLTIFAFLTVVGSLTSVKNVSALSCTGGTKVCPGVGSNGCRNTGTATNPNCTCSGNEVAYDTCKDNGSGSCVANVKDQSCVWNGSACVLAGSGNNVQIKCSDGAATPPPGSSPTPGGCVRTCTKVTECRQAGNCSGTKGSACGTDIYGKTKYNCTYDKCTTVCPTSTPTKPPTPTPVQTAYCQSISAYTTSWSLMSMTQLQSMSGGQKLYYCANGSATSGLFDRARFTINSVLTPETTLKRTNSNDYCYLYTLPTGKYSFNIVAEMHHTTLGWVR